MNTITFLPTELKQITEIEALQLPRGSVILVRSDYKHEKYGDHAALILGGIIKKERGLRPNLLTFSSKTILNSSELLNMYDEINGKIILLLTPDAANKFMANQEMHLSEGEVISAILKQ